MDLGHFTLSPSLTLSHSDGLEASSVRPSRRRAISIVSLKS